MKISGKNLGIAIFLILFGSIALSSASGYWQTESSKEPVRFEDGAFEGMPNPADIRGSYSFSDISEAFGIPVDDLIKSFALAEDTNPSEFKNKDLELLYGELKEEGTEIGNASVKLFVSMYLGLPYESEEETFLPLEAVEILKEKAELTEEQIEYIDRNGIDVSPYHLEKASDLDSVDELAIKGEGVDERSINGKTTFENLLEWGISWESIVEILGEDIPRKDISIKDFCTQNGLNFMSIKEALQKEAAFID